METTDKDSCIIISQLLLQHGVRHAIISPGSRNAPLVVALARCNEIKKTVVIDERSAAFIALGIAAASSLPVALVCTSGSALLNYAPAIAEAYYRRLPLVVISADRPAEWIDQDDSQTIRQYEALANYVKRSYNIPAQCPDETTRWYINRIVNDALLSAVSNRPAPVHINVQLDEPLNKMTERPVLAERQIDLVSSCNTISNERISSLCNMLYGKKVLIIAGFNAPDNDLNTTLQHLAKDSGIAVMTESISNLKSEYFISSIDRTLNVMTPNERKAMTPDVVITLGGALISRHIKQYMRQSKPAEHWHIGISDTTIDCFMALTKRIEIAPKDFFKQLSTTLENSADREYALRWHTIATNAKTMHDKYVEKVAWSDLKAFDIIINTIPKQWNLHFSNGTAIRYAQLFDTSRFNRNDCNRGVSGIDGCTSTAIGASTVSTETTLLITGDMSAQYDMGALASTCITPRFKMIVINNSGGGIFRFIQSTSQLPELEEYFVASPRFPIKELADGLGFRFFDASSATELKETLTAFISEDSKPAILRVNTPAIESAEILKGYFKH